ncbi:hypothetical protein PIB28_08805 [Enterococcus faecium]
MSIDDCLEEQIRLFLKFLKVKVQNNYFTCYSYAHPVLNSLPFNSLVQGLITNIVLLVCTPNEIFKKDRQWYFFSKIKRERIYSKDYSYS